MLAKNNMWIGVPCMVLGGFFVALQGYLAKLTVSSVTTEMFTFARFFVGFLPIFLYLLFLNRVSTFFKKYVKTHSLSLLIAAGVMGAFATWCYFFSLKQITTSVATTLFLSFPIFIPLIGRIGLKKVLCPHLWWGLVLSFIGVVFILHPTKSFFHWMSILALLSGIMTGVYFVLTRLLHHTESTLKMIFYYFGVAMIISALMLIVKACFSKITLTKVEVYYLIAIGIAGLLCQLFFSLSVRYASERVLTPFIYSSLIFTLVFDHFYLGMPVSLWEIVGMVCIVLGVIAIVVLTPRDHRGNL